MSKKNALIPAIPDDFKDKPIEDMSAKEADSTLVKLNFAMTAGKLAQARLLKHMFDNKLYIQLGQSTFKEYVESINIPERTAYERKKVADFMEICNINDKEVKKIGFSKVARVAPKADVNSSEYWLKKARELSYRELSQEIVKSHTRIGNNSGAEAEEEKETLTAFNAMLTDSQLETVRSALDIASAQLEGRVKGKGSLLSLICLDFNSSAIMQSGGDSTLVSTVLEWYLQRIEDTFGVELSILKSDE